MDMQKMGSFLRELRMEHNLTQEALGEKVGVTNKTVSRWETGRYMPPVQCLEILSDLYQISMNEMIAGKRLEADSFKDTAEENMKAALRKNQRQNKRFQRGMLMIFAITSILACCAILLVPLDQARGLLVIALIIAITFLANTMNILALILSFSEPESKIGECGEKSLPKE